MATRQQVLALLARGYDYARADEHRLVDPRPYGPLAGAAAATAVTGWFPRLGRAATAGAALTGPAVAAYTGVLLADTAVPAWHEAHRQLPFTFAGSAAAAAGGLGMILAPVGEAGPARRAAVFGAVAETVSSAAAERGMGIVAQTYRQGRAGTLLRAAKALTVAGALGGAVFGGRSRTAAALSGAALVAGSVCTRFGIFEAGLASARDPRYTVVPSASASPGAADPVGPGGRCRLPGAPPAAAQWPFYACGCVDRP
ncbi:hypothetical protein AB0H83_13010 [Dactylosporangium sp. NPDC050688]|uniref:hypothetical protein n=1 Tax=Dactylosporangium sp. NPDC050688 TaxID=3157217 RepID=UPI0033CC554B